MKNKYPFPLMVIHWLTFCFSSACLFHWWRSNSASKKWELYIFAGVSVFLLFLSEL